MLENKIKDSHGNESIELTKAEAEQLAAIAKEGKFKAEEYGLTAPDIINIDLMMKEAYKAGVTAAAITYCCKSGLLGDSMKNVDPSVVGAVVVLAMNVIKGSFAVALGKKTRIELANEIVKGTFISACALISGGISQTFIEIPVLGYLIGSFVGSIVGSFTYDYGYNKALSFCVDTGFTLFGLVEQDYTLPDDIIKEMGIATFDYETFDVERFEPDSFEMETFTFDTFEPDSLEITFLRRGVIGVSKIGYVG